MAKLNYGKVKKLNFNSSADEYETIGILTAANYTKIKIEQNQLSGAWGSEGRILIYSNANKFLQPLPSRFTAGTGNILHRINCNDFVLELITKHGFTTKSVTATGKTADVTPPTLANALTSIPAIHHADFMRGYNK